MGNVVAFELPPRRAMERIRRLWELGDLDWGLGHSEQRLMDRGLGMLDVEHLVRFGHVVEWCKPGREWRYTVEGAAVDGKRIAAVFELRKEDMTVVTVMLR